MKHSHDSAYEAQLRALRDEADRKQAEHRLREAVIGPAFVAEFHRAIDVGHEAEQAYDVALTRANALAEGAVAAQRRSHP